MDLRIKESKINSVRIDSGDHPAIFITHEYFKWGGKIVINCRGVAWMATNSRITDIESYFANDLYLCRDFIPINRRFEPDIQATINNIKQEILKTRRQEYTSKSDIRIYWNKYVKGIGWIGGGKVGLESADNIGEIYRWVALHTKIGEEKGLLFKNVDSLIQEKETEEMLWFRNDILPIIQKAFQ